MALTVLEPTGSACSPAREVLCRIGWLSRQPSELRELVLRSATLRRVREKAAVYHQGDEPDGIYGVLSGYIKIETLQSDGRSTAMGMMREGSWFGELSTIEGSQRPSSAYALTDAVVLHISLTLYQRILEQDPRHMLSFANLLSDKVQTGNWIRVELADPDPTARVSKVLLLLADLRDWSELSAEIVIPVSQDEIAKLANLSRPTVNNSLKLLEKRGLVECRYKAIILIPGR